MKLQLFFWLTFGTLLGVFLGFQFGKGDPMAPLVVGSVGALVGLAGFFIVSFVHRARSIDSLKTDNFAMVSAIAGALLGAALGGVVGVYSGFGSIMISIFNPDLMERDFGASFGAIGGIFLGAFLGACLGSVGLQFLRRRQTSATKMSTINRSESSMPQ
jgi:hypothetical protein